MRKEIIQERLGRYLRLAEQVARGKYPEREGYITHKLEKVVPNALRALSKVQSGVGDVCEDCGDTIPPKRIEAVPAAIRCRTCQEKYESRLACYL